MENASLQSLIKILQRIPVQEIQACLSESPLMAPGKSSGVNLIRWLERPVELALQFGLEPVAHAVGADPHELLAFIHPCCPNATACFQRLTMLRPDRVWSGEPVHICRTVRPLSLRWNGPDDLELVLVEGCLEVDHSNIRARHSASTIAIPPETTCFFAHPSTFMVRHTWIFDLVDHAFAAGIPITLPPLLTCRAAATRDDIKAHSGLAHDLFHFDKSLGPREI